MEQVVGLQASLAGALGLIVDKFGKQEAAGRGLRGLIGEACRWGRSALGPQGGPCVSPLRRMRRSSLRTWISGGRSDARLAA
nr:DUF2478 domain-containing protein [Haematobacter sp. UBA3484]